MLLFTLALAALRLAAANPFSPPYNWNNVHTGGGGGYIPGVIFNPTQRGLAFIRTDIGGAYKLGWDGKWVPLLDFVDNPRWDYWGVESIATDPVNPLNLYLEVGIYTNSWDPNNGTILKSRDQGNTFQAITLPFKVGGNMPGRGVGERLVIDPHNNNVLYLGARSGNGLWRSTDAGLTWHKVTSFTWTGSFVIDPTDSSGYNSDPIGVGWIVFDTTSTKTFAGTSRIFVGVETAGSANIFVSNDHGSTWSAVPGQQTTYLTHHGILSPAEKSLYVTYVNGAGPWDGTAGSIAKYNITSGNWTDITPAQAKSDDSYGFGGLTIDPQKPGTVMTASLNQWYPDAEIWRSLDGGATWSNLYNFSYPAPEYSLTVTRDYTWDLSVAPWIQSYTTDSKQIGWGIDGLAIDPFDSNHFLYGTGLTLYGSKNALKWDTVHNITLSCLANGIEETAVTALISPPTGAHLLSAVGDIGGWVHDNLDVAPPTLFVPVWGTVTGIDYAGKSPLSIVRVGGGGGQIATSTDGGHGWTTLANAPSTASGGSVTYTANTTSIVWSSSSGVITSTKGGAFTPVAGLPTGTLVQADKANDSYVNHVYASSGGALYVSSDAGVTFKETITLGTSNATQGLAVNQQGTAGELWISTNLGVWHSKNFGKTATQLGGNLKNAYAISAGAPATPWSPPSIFTFGIVGTVPGVWRSDDGGDNWNKISDSQHGFSSISQGTIAADPRIYRRVYLGTNGRGIFYGN